MANLRDGYERAALHPGGRGGHRAQGPMLHPRGAGARAGSVAGVAGGMMFTFMCAVRVVRLERERAEDVALRGV